MQKVKKAYRTEYQGEEIVKDLVWESGDWHKTTEYVPNNVINNQISNKAVILGNGPSRLELAPNFLGALKNHKGGLLASGRVQTYGCNALYRDYEPDFLIATGDRIVQEIAASGYTANHIVYTTQDGVLDYPGMFYLTPQNPHWNAGAIAAYLAAFDGHKTVYLVGFDTHSGDSTAFYNVYADTNAYPASTESSPEAYFIKSLTTVMNIYNDVDFVRVCPTADFYMPDEWKYQLNLRQISFRDFVTEVDL